jgi:hypothetical protein
MRIFVYEYLSLGLLDAPSLLREGSAMLRAALTDFAKIPGVEVITMVAPSVDLSGIKAQITPFLKDSDDEENAFRELARSAAWCLIIAPEFADLLATRCEWVIEEGSQLLGPSPRAVRMCGDKLWLAEYFKKLRIPTIPTHLLHPAGHHQGGIVCKPRHGAGSQATYYLFSPGDLATVLQRARAEGCTDEMIVQPLVHGTAMSKMALIGPEGRIETLLTCEQSIRFAYNKISYEGGIVRGDRTTTRAEAELLRNAVQAIPGMFGIVGFDLIGHHPQIVEINPRLTTSYLGLRALTKVNLMQALLAVVQGQPIEPFDWQPRRIDFRPDGSISTEGKSL